MLRKATLRLFLRNHAQGANKAQIDKIINDSKLFDKLDDAIAHEAKGRPVLDFMKFLIANRQAIMDLIKLITGK